MQLPIPAAPPHPPFGELRSFFAGRRHPACLSRALSLPKSAGRSGIPPGLAVAMAAQDAGNAHIQRRKRLLPGPPLPGTSVLPPFHLRSTSVVRRFNRRRYYPGTTEVERRQDGGIRPVGWRQPARRQGHPEVGIGDPMAVAKLEQRQITWSHLMMQACLRRISPTVRSRAGQSLAAFITAQEGFSAGAGRGNRRRLRAPREGSRVRNLDTPPGAPSARGKADRQRRRRSEWRPHSAAESWRHGAGR